MWLHHYWLVGGIPTPLKNMSKSVGMMTEWKVIKFHGSKPPASWGLYQIHLFRLHLPPFSPRLRRVHRQRWGTSCPHFAKNGNGGSLRPSPFPYVNECEWCKWKHNMIRACVRSSFPTALFRHLMMYAGGLWIRLLSICCLSNRNLLHKLSQNITEHQMECLADTFGLAKQQDFGCFPRVHLPQEVDCIKWCVSSASSLWIRYPSHPQSVDCPKSVVVALSWRWLATSTVANPWPLVDHVGGSRSA